MCIFIIKYSQLDLLPTRAMFHTANAISSNGKFVTDCIFSLALATSSFWYVVARLSLHLSDRALKPSLRGPMGETIRQHSLILREPRKPTKRVCLPLRPWRVPASVSWKTMFFSSGYACYLSVHLHSCSTFNMSGTRGL